MSLNLIFRLVRIECFFFHVDFFEELIWRLQNKDEISSFCYYEWYFIFPLSLKAEISFMINYKISVASQKVVPSKASTAPTNMSSQFVISKKNAK